MCQLSVCQLSVTLYVYFYVIYIYKGLSPLMSVTRPITDITDITDILTHHVYDSDEPTHDNGIIPFVQSIGPRVPPNVFNFVPSQTKLAPALFTRK